MNSYQDDTILTRKKSSKRISIDGTLSFFRRRSLRFSASRCSSRLPRLLTPRTQGAHDKISRGGSGCHPSEVNKGFAETRLSLQCHVLAESEATAASSVSKCSKTCNLSVSGQRSLSNLMPRTRDRQCNPMTLNVHKERCPIR